MKSSFEIDQVIQVFSRRGKRGNTALFVVDVEFQIIDFDRVILLGHRGTGADNIANRWVWFEEKLTIDGALCLRIS